MILLMRHGDDDDSELGGWSDAGLSPNGIEQVKRACESLAGNKLDIRHIKRSASKLLMRRSYRRIGWLIWAEEKKRNKLG